MKIEIHKVQLAGPAPKFGKTDPVLTCTTPDGVKHTGEDAIHKAARHLIGKGVDPNAGLRVFRGDKKILSGKIESFARLSWAGPAKDPAFELWKPHHKSPPMPPALAAWWEEQLRLRGKG